jgi:protein SCO1/2/putative membrane protein
MKVRRSYWDGILIVLLAVLAAGAVAPLVARREAVPPRAAQDLGEQGEELGPFELVERSGQRVSQADLADRVCIVSFIFTRCQLSCPRISAVMKSLQDRLEGSDALLVSLSVDPRHDTPEVLAEYARRFNASPERWWFLTGSRTLIYGLIESKFKLSVMENPAPDAGGQAEAIAHSDRLALVDRGHVVGLFDSNEPTALKSLVEQAKRKALPAWIRGLPAVNASLNSLCALLLLLGWTAIRGQTGVSASQNEPMANASSRRAIFEQPRVRLHLACMVLAVLASSLFLVCYLVYHFHAGGTPFRGQGTSRWIYFTILISHTFLATFCVVPYVFLTLLRALRRDFASHRLIAATTLPIWLYVSVTGVLIYLLLYHLPVPKPSLMLPM